MTILSEKEFHKWWKKVEEGLKHPVGPVPTPKLEEGMQRVLEAGRRLKRGSDMTILKAKDLKGLKIIVETRQDFDGILEDTIIDFENYLDQLVEKKVAKALKRLKADL
jgi:hypothetical protein